METLIYIFLYIIFKIHIHTIGLLNHKKKNANVKNVKFVIDFIKVLPHCAAFLSCTKMNVLSTPSLTLSS